MAGGNRQCRRGRGGVPGAQGRGEIGTAAGAEVGYPEYQCGPVREATGTTAWAEVGYRASDVDIPDSLGNFHEISMLHA